MPSSLPEILVLSALAIAVLLGLRAFLIERRERKISQRAARLAMEKYLTDVIDENEIRLADFFSVDLDKIKAIAGSLEGEELVLFKGLTALTHRMSLIVFSLTIRRDTNRIIVKDDIAHDLLTQSFAVASDEPPVSPRYVGNELDELFRAAMHIRLKLLEAVEVCDKIAEVHFPPATFAQLEAACDHHDLSRAWLALHPLYGDDASRASFYEGFNARRLKTPLAFKAELDRYLMLEQELSGRVNELTILQFEVTESHIGELVVPSITFDPADDPWILFELVRHDEADLHMLLQTGSDHRDLVEIRGLVGTIIDRYKKIRTLQAAAARVVSMIEKRLELAQAVIGRYAESARLAKMLVDKTRSSHTNLLCETVLGGAFAEIEQANTELANAQTQIAARRLLTARRQLEDIGITCERAGRLLEYVRAHCATLDGDKARYLKELADMPQARAHAVESITRFGGDATQLPALRETQANEPTNYTQLLANLANQRRIWQSHVSAAKAAWDAEQKRIALFRTFQQELERARTAFEATNRELMSLNVDTQTVFITWPGINSTETSTAEDIEHDRTWLRESQTRWSTTVRNIKYARVMELKRKNRLEEFRTRCDHVEALASNYRRLMVGLDGDPNQITFDPPSVDDNASLEHIEHAFESMETQHQNWVEIFSTLQREHEAKRLAESGQRSGIAF